MMRKIWTLPKKNHFRLSPGDENVIGIRAFNGVKAGDKAVETWPAQPGEVGLAELSLVIVISRYHPYVLAVGNLMEANQMKPSWPAQPEDVGHSRSRVHIVISRYHQYVLAVGN